jgi:D-alanyl-D-alanine carboxypeptidase/D-alanyl-D-alanine-endopeptidase (penicillin-binding protein 4)
VRATPPDAVVVARHHSEPYQVLLQRLLKRSDNHYGELLFRQLSVHHGDGSGSAEDAGRVVREWVSRFVLAEPDDLLMVDGSGLSRLDLATARLLCDILQYMQRHQEGALFRNALPCAGADGTLRTRFMDQPARGRVWAKTGYIGQVRTISGYVVQEGEKLAPVFSILMNHYLVETKDISRLQDAMVQAIAAWASGMDESEIRSAARMSPQ